MKARIGSLDGASGTRLFVALPSHRHTTFLPLNLQRPWQIGRICDAVVRQLKIGANGGGGFCEGADGKPLYLRRTQSLCEGQHIRVEIIGEARGSKPASAQVTTAPVRRAGLHSCLRAHKYAGPIEVMNIDLLPLLRDSFPNDSFILGSQDSDLVAHANELLETQTLERNDLRLRWDTTPTAHHLDVDGTGRPEVVNAQAAELAAQIILSRNLGGILFLDFLAPATRQARRNLTHKMQQCLASSPHRLKIHAMNESGHLIVERQRLCPEFTLEAYRPGAPT